MTTSKVQIEIAEDSILRYHSHFSNKLKIKTIHVESFDVTVQSGVKIRLVDQLNGEFEFYIGHPDDRVAPETYVNPNDPDAMIRVTHSFTLSEGTIITPSSGIKQKVVGHLTVYLASETRINLKPNTRLISCRDYKSYILTELRAAFPVLKDLYPY